jgi:hypothetical protein
MKTKFEDRIFWKDGFDLDFIGEAEGGIHFRSFDLNKFIEKVEIEEGKEVVGIQFEGNNLELITKK